MEFFPPNSLDKRPYSHQLRDRWYVSHLLAMEERPLDPPGADQHVVYRLLFLPTFQRPFVARLTQADGTWCVVCKRTDGRGGYGPCRLTGDREHGLTRVEVKQFTRLLDRVAFWDTPSSEDATGLDGSRAVLEGVRPGRYHVTDRWSPRGTPYAELVEFLLGLGRGVGDPCPEPPKYHTSFADLLGQYRARAADEN